MWLFNKKSSIKIKDSASSMVNVLFFDGGRKAFADKIFSDQKTSLIQKRGADRNKFMSELFVFDDVFLSIFLQREAVSINKDKLGKEIYNEFCNQLMKKMGEVAYKGYLNQSDSRKEGYLKVFTKENFIEKVGLVFLVYVLEGTPQFDDVDSPGFFELAEINLYLNYRVIELKKFCGHILNPDLVHKKVNQGTLYKESQEKLMKLSETVKDVINEHLDETNKKVIRDGLQRIYYKSGKLQIEFTLKDGEAEGPFKSYYENGKLQTEGTWKGYNRLDGLAKVYYENGLLKTEEVIKNGIPNGPCKKYHENGKLKGELNYTNGKTDGPFKTYGENGALMGEGVFKDGKNDGLNKTYYESGELKQELNFKDGIVDGSCKAYYKNGNLAGEWVEKNGKIEGISKIYYENGSVECIDIYKEGEIINRKAYDINGKLKP